jgi:hypothetical protein
MSAAFFSCATLPMTSKVSDPSSAVTVGTPDLMIPAFSAAICVSVSPSLLVIEADIRDDAGERRDDIRRVSHPPGRFPKLPNALPPGEILQRHHVTTSKSQ